MARARTTAKISVLTLDRAPMPAATVAAFSPVDLSAFEEPAAPTRLWDLHPSLHCSIIGTCLTNAELRQILRKAGVSNADRLSDHGLHHEAVSLCSKRNAASKLVHKALDRKHRCTINQFNRAKSKDEVHALWRGFLEKGEIPGSYWAVLTHAHSDNELIQTVFADVHMLSHLVGAANRADIRRLRELEQENAGIQEKVQQQQARLRDAIVERDETIQGLRASLADALTSNGKGTECGDSAGDTTAEVIAYLKNKLERQAERTRRLEARLEAMTSELAPNRGKNVRNRAAGSWSCRQSWRPPKPVFSPACPTGEIATGENDLCGRAVLYVGGRSEHGACAKKAGLERGADFLHHDGGVEDNSYSLTALVARADAVFFSSRLYQSWRRYGCETHLQAIGQEVLPAKKLRADQFCRGAPAPEIAGCLPMHARTKLIADLAPPYVSPVMRRSGLCQDRRGKPLKRKLSSSRLPASVSAANSQSLRNPARRTWSKDWRMRSMLRSTAEPPR